MAMNPATIRRTVESRRRNNQYEGKTKNAFDGQRFGPDAD
jgi:hypothetical protein